MGLDFSHCEAHWGYGRFNHFRTRLINAVNWNQRTTHDWPDGLSEIKDDPIYPLLNHSDCDDNLSPTECKQIIPRLSQIISLWTIDDQDRENAELLIEGMKSAIAADEPLEFC